ncbi:MAG: SHOCT domain-containing protein [Agriterribacter sp.]
MSMTIKSSLRVTGMFAAVLFFSALTVKAQENEDGKLVKDTLVLKSGARFVVGDKIELGYGSGISKIFDFVFVSPYAFVNPGLKLGSNWAKHTLVIKKIEFYGNKKIGKKFHLVLSGGDISNYWCNIVPAIEQKEVIVKGVNDGGTTAGAPAKEGKSSSTSLADELKKLKELHDAKALTDKEYEAAKKKLLEQ